MKNKELLIIVTGASGLLGSYLVIELEKQGIPFLGFSKRELDITDLESSTKLLQGKSPTHIINCAAFTNVSRSEIEKDECFRANVIGVKNLIIISNKLGSKLIQISTDYVFDGRSKITSYKTNRKKKPLNYYGQTKHEAEELIINFSKSFLIIRTSWLYGNSKNDFVGKILFAVSTNSKLMVVNDEFGSPTYAKDLAKSILDNLNTDYKILHLVNDGYISRYDFAKKILQLKNLDIQVFPSQHAELSIMRPKKIRLINGKGIIINDLRNWEDALIEFLIS
jgi:dTDP-4-dehydrorhamnose reductase